MYTYIRMQPYKNVGHMPVFAGLEALHYIHAYKYIHIYTHIHAAIQERGGCASVRRFGSTYMHTYTHAYIYKQIHTYIYMQPYKSVGDVPVFAGLEAFTLRSLGLTSLEGLGSHPEVCVCVCVNLCV